jgi:hypothetical protein
VFVTVDLEGSAKEPVVNFFGIKEGDAPVVVGFDMGGNKKYKFADDIRWVSCVCVCVCVCVMVGGCT